MKSLGRHFLVARVGLFAIPNVWALSTHAELDCWESASVFQVNESPDLSAYCASHAYLVLDATSLCSLI